MIFSQVLHSKSLPPPQGNKFYLKYSWTLKHEAPEKQDASEVNTEGGQRSTQQWCQTVMGHPQCSDMYIAQ